MEICTSRAVMKMTNKRKKNEVRMGWMDAQAEIR